MVRSVLISWWTNDGLKQEGLWAKTVVFSATVRQGGGKWKLQPIYAHHHPVLHSLIQILYRANVAYATSSKREPGINGPEVG